MHTGAACENYSKRKTEPSRLINQFQLLVMSVVGDFNGTETGSLSGSLFELLFRKLIMKVEESRVRITIKKKKSTPEIPVDPYPERLMCWPLKVLIKSWTSKSTVKPVSSAVRRCVLCYRQASLSRTMWLRTFSSNFSQLPIGIRDA